ncbi:hypothetical protein [Hymenobacter terrenus]|nr:hypothetical protein [Hymenobacter terrenus]
MIRKLLAVEGAHAALRAGLQAPLPILADDIYYTLGQTVGNSIFAEG